jgi:hypothetical protein
MTMEGSIFKLITDGMTASLHRTSRAESYGQRVRMPLQCRRRDVYTHLQVTHPVLTLGA